MRLTERHLVCAGLSGLLNKSSSSMVVVTVDNATHFNDIYVKHKGKQTDRYVSFITIGKKAGL